MSGQNRRIGIPKRFSIPMRELLSLQPRFHRREGRRALAFLAHPRFRAAYDFLLLRAEAGAEDPAIAQWWTEIQTLAAEQQRERVGRGVRRRAGRRARGGAVAGAAAAATGRLRPRLEPGWPGVRPTSRSAATLPIRGARSERAFDALAGMPGTRLIRRSGLWRSQPMGPQDQPEFINAAAGLLTTLAPREFLDGDAGDRAAAWAARQPVERWGPRVIDLDLVVYSDECRDEPGLTLPHPGLHQRNFVLYPLAEIAAELWVPGLARVCRLREQVSPEGIERLAARGSGDD